MNLLVEELDSLIELNYHLDDTDQYREYKKRRNYSEDEKKLISLRYNQNYLNIGTKVPIFNNLTEKEINDWLNSSALYVRNENIYNSNTNNKYIVPMLSILTYDEIYEYLNTFTLALFKKRKRK